MGQQFDKAASLGEIVSNAWECLRGSRHKDGPTEFCFTAVTSGKSLRDEILGGRYHERKGNTVRIARPKPRVATAPWFRDRVWQRSMCNNGVYDDLTRDSLWESMACQKGKGTDLTIRAVVEMLWELHITSPGAPVYGRHLDVRKFFQSTPHEEIKRLDRQKITEPKYLPYLTEIIEHHEDRRLPEEITADPHGARGTGLGSEINQLHQVSLLDDLDREAVRTVRCYLRYNDDFLLLDHDQAKVDAAAELIDNGLTALGLEVVDKAGRFRASDGFCFLRKRFILKPSGKIIIQLHPKALTEERRVLRGLKRKLDRGERSYQQIRSHYQSWVANASYAGNGPIRAMDNYYKTVFGRAPEYKLKRRHLYGHHHHPAGKGSPAGAGKPTTAGTVGSDAG